MNIKLNDTTFSSIFKEKIINAIKSTDRRGITSKKLKLLNKLSKNNSVKDLRHDYYFKLKAAELEQSKISDKDKNPKVLRRDLSLNRINLQRKKDELTSLKIKYNKLDEQNMNNKNILSKILSISPDDITKRKLKIKMDKVKLNKKDRSLIENAHQIISLRLQIFNKKREMEKKNDIIEDLQNNSRIKIVNEYQNECLLICKQQDKLINLLKKLEKKYDKYDKKVNELKEIVKNENKKKIKLLEDENNIVKQYRDTEDNKDSLINQVVQLEEKLRKLDKKNNDLDKNVKEAIIRINSKEEQLYLLKNYIDRRKEILEYIEDKKKSKEALDASILKQNRVIQKLSSDYYHKLHKKTIFCKLKEKEKNSEKFKLKIELESLYEVKEIIQDIFIEKQSELKDISERLNLNIVKNKEIINNNKKEKEILNQKIEDFRKKNDEIEKKYQKIQENIHTQQKELNELTLKKANLIIQKNIIMKNVDDVDALKKVKYLLTDENDKLRQENNKYKNEIEKLNLNLKDYDKIENQLKEANIKLNILKNKKKK